MITQKRMLRFKVIRSGAFLLISALFVEFGCFGLGVSFWGVYSRTYHVMS